MTDICVTSSAMDSSYPLPASGINLPPPAGCHNPPYISSLGLNVCNAQSRTGSMRNLERKCRDEMTFLPPEGVAQILTDGISEVRAFKCKESAQNANPALNRELNKLKNIEQNSRDGFSNCYSSSLSRKRKLKYDMINKVTADVFLKPSFPSDNVTVSNLSSRNLATSESYDKMTSAKSHSLDKLSKIDHDILHLEISTRVKSRSEEPRDYLLTDSGTNQSMLGKKKIKSKTRNKTNDGLVNVEYTHTAVQSVDECAIMVPRRYATIQVTGKTTDRLKWEDKAPPNGHAPRCVVIQSSEVPSQAQLEKLLTMHSGSYDLQCPPQWLEGDLLWAKVSGHPFWPCMVSRCPFSKIYTRIKGGVHIFRSYHVQFFGNEAERGWINEPSLIIFEGKLKFLEIAQLELLKNKKGKSAYNPFKINISRQHPWNLAVEEAEGAIHLSREERYVQYTFDYIFTDDLKKEQQRMKKELQESSKMHIDDFSVYKPIAHTAKKRASSEGNSCIQSLDNHKKCKLDISSPHVKSLGAETSFSAYYAKHRSAVIEQHPDLGTSFVFEYLQQQWESEKKKTLKPEPTISCSETLDGDKYSNSDSTTLTHLNDDPRYSNSHPQLVKLLCREIQSVVLPMQSTEEQA